MWKWDLSGCQWLKKGPWDCFGSYYEFREVSLAILSIIILLLYAERWSRRILLWIWSLLIHHLQFLLSLLTVPFFHSGLYIKKKSFFSSAARLFVVHNFALNSFTRESTDEGRVCNIHLHNKTFCHFRCKMSFLYSEFSINLGHGHRHTQSMQ